MRRRNWNDDAASGLATVPGPTRQMSDVTVYRGTPGDDRFTGTAGDDKWFAGVGGEDWFDGLGGSDTAVIDFSAEDGGDPSFFITNYHGFFQGDARWSNGSASFQNVESVNMSGTLGNDAFDVDAAPLKLGGFLRLDGAGGTDSLKIQFGGITKDITFIPHANGHVESNVGTYLNFETFFVIGGSGDDILGGGSGNDILIGGGGNDTVTYAEAASRVRVQLGLDTGQLTGGAGRDGVSAENLIGSDFADVFIGDDKRNVLTGGRGADRLSGSGNSDLLLGETANDRLFGGGGRDTLVGGHGADSMTGGGAADVFRFDSLEDFGSKGKFDRITDFSAAQGDHIDLSLIDPDPVAPGDQSFTFIGTAAFTSGGSDYQLRYEGIDGGDLRVEGDVDHDGSADFVFIVHAVDLSGQDFNL